MKKTKPTSDPGDGLFESAPEDVQKLRRQARREQRDSSRKQWWADNKDLPPSQRKPRP